MIKSKSKILLILHLLLSCFSILSISNISPVFANTNCSTFGIYFNGMSGPFYAGLESESNEFTISGINNIEVQKVSCVGPSGQNDIIGPFEINSKGEINKSGNNSFNQNCWSNTGQHEIVLQYNNDQKCKLHEYTVSSAANAFKCVNPSLFNAITSEQTLCFENQDTHIEYRAEIINTATNKPVEGVSFRLDSFTHDVMDYKRWIRRIDFEIPLTAYYSESSKKSFLGVPTNIGIEQNNIGTGERITYILTKDGVELPSCNATAVKVPNGQCSRNYIDPRDDDSKNKNPFNLCAQVNDELMPGQSKSPRQACKDCQDTNGIWTALGCIPTDGAGTVRTFISIALGMAGGIGLLMIIAAGAMFALSQNDPTKVNSARDLLTSVIIGLLFIVFSVTILQFIGVTILQIPGFGT